MNPGACILDAFGQLWEIPCFKGLRGGWFPRKRDKDFILKLLVRWETRINFAQQLKRRKSTNHQNRYAPIIFYHRLLGQLPQDDRTFYTVQFWLTAELIPQLKAGKLDIVVATQKITLSAIEYELLFEKNFWLVRPPNAIVPISEGISQADLNPLSQWLLTQPWIAYSEQLPIAPRFWRMVFGRIIDVQPKLIILDLRAIRQALESGFGFSVLPDYLCADWVK